MTEKSVDFSKIQSRAGIEIVKYSKPEIVKWFIIASSLFIFLIGVVLFTVSRIEYQIRTINRTIKEESKKTREGVIEDFRSIILDIVSTPESIRVTEEVIPIIEIIDSTG